MADRYADRPRRFPRADDDRQRRDRLRERRQFGNDDAAGVWWDPYGYDYGLYARGYGAPVLPPPEPEYPPLAPPIAQRPGDPWSRSGTRARRDREGRSFLDRAEDEISSWFGDDEAEARRRADHRGRGPKGYVRADARIEEDVQDRLTDDPVVDATEISVSVSNSEVTLDGTVDARVAKRAAEDCADSVSGVTHVQNNLRVQPASR